MVPARVSAGTYRVVDLDDFEPFKMASQDTFSYARENILGGFRVLRDQVKTGCEGSTRTAYDGGCFVTNKGALLWRQAFLSKGHQHRHQNKGMRTHMI